MDRVAIANIALSHVQQKPLKLLAGESFDVARADNLAHQAVLEHFDPVRREALASHAWGFATVKRNLTRSTYNPPEIRWVLSYVYPADCIRFIGLTDITATGGEYGRIYPLDSTVTLEEVEGSGLARPGAEALVSPTGVGLNEIASDALGQWMRWETRAFRDTDGRLKRVILANLPGAVGEYVVDVDDTLLWSPQFVTAFGYLLAARIAPAVSKFNEGNRAFAIWMKILEEAKAVDANESNPRIDMPAEWTRARRSRR